MDPISFAVTVVLMTASGALTPGPLFFATISQGARAGAKSGFIFSIAHTIVEFTLVMLLAFGLLPFLDKPVIRQAVGIAGGIALLLFGTLQIYEALQHERERTKPRQVKTRNLLLIGLAFTGLNPFFIVWWLTVGASLIFLSLEFASFLGVLFMYVCHVWMDYLWLTIVAHLAKIGTNTVESKWYRAIITVFGAILLYFGFTFLISSLF